MKILRNKVIYLENYWFDEEVQWFESLICVLVEVEQVDGDRGVGVKHVSCYSETHEFHSNPDHLKGSGLNLYEGLSYINLRLKIK